MQIVSFLLVKAHYFLKACDFFSFKTHTAPILCFLIEAGPPIPVTGSAVASKNHQTVVFHSSGMKSKYSVFLHQLDNSERAGKQLIVVSISQCLGIRSMLI